MALAAGVGAVPAEGVAPAKHAATCAAPRTRTLANSDALRIYETRPRPGGPPRAVLACLSGHRGHMTLLAPTRLNQHTSLARFELAGHVAAYLETQFGVDSGTRKLVVVDVGARRVLHAIEAGSYIDAGLIFDEAVVQFLVSSHGSLAWTVTREEHRGPPVESVWAVGREGAHAALRADAVSARDQLAGHRYPRSAISSAKRCSGSSSVAPISSRSRAIR
jgi:hypothetical protein